MRTDRGRRATARQLGRYVLVGGLSTGLNAVLFLLLRTWWDTVPATLSALVLSTLVSTECNRRFTFAGARREAWRMHAQTAGTVAFYAGFSSLVLAVLGALVDEPSAGLQSAAVAGASVLGGLGRFLLLRQWVFRGAGTRAGWLARAGDGLRGPVVGTGSAAAS